MLAIRAKPHHLHNLPVDRIEGLVPEESCRPAIVDPAGRGSRRTAFLSEVPRVVVEQSGQVDQDEAESG